jgi:activator of HSP90 ATPase
VNLTHSHEVSKTNLNYACINTQNSLDFPSNEITKAFLKKKKQAVQSLARFTFLIDPYNECLANDSLARWF